MPRLTIFKKILCITLLLSLLPLVTSSSLLFFNLEAINTRLPAEIAETSDIQASESLQMRAQHVADTISDFLRHCENDVLFLASSNLDRTTLMNFYIYQRNEIWERIGPPESPRDLHLLVPLYRSIALIDPSGKERIVIRDGKFLDESQLRDISQPGETEFKQETYFEQIKSLNKREVYVSHLTGYHVSRAEQLAGATEPENAYNGTVYRGVIRFGSPVFDTQGRYNGMVVISLDHRHLMEFSQHIDPGRNFSTIFPSYKTGNYAFLFDDEGWIITHPKYWDIRGLDRNGKLLPPYTVTSSKADVDAGKIPFNLDRAGFIHPNYPKVAAEVRQQHTGFVDITNVGGSKKIMAYAPILYDTGEYRTHGVFGGVTIGFQVDQFHDAARKGSRLITKQLGEHRTRSAIILMITALLSGLSAWGLSRGISLPLRQLTDGAHKLAQGDTSYRVAVTSSDEIGDLANTFNFMAEELQIRKNSLLSTLDELRSSRLEIMDERNFKESILESISSAIVTFSPDGLLTSINATGRMFLGNEICVGKHHSQVFAGWGEMDSLVTRSLNSGGHYGREPFSIERNGTITHFEIGFFPIGRDAEKGLTVTMRNETEKEKLREEMMRLDRLASLGKLSAGIAHEVRNPLTGISLLLDDLHDRAAAASEDQVMIKKAVAEIERVERLINALLNYSSPARVEFRQSELNLVVHDTVLLMRRQCEKQKVRISTNAGNLAPFRFDPEKIKQALLNITRNALEAMPDGGEIIIATSSDTEHAIITISDTGPGIRENDLALIFEPFFTRKGAGTGLGLSITQRIVEEHHGQIVAENAASSGTVFTLKLPLNAHNIG
jgi:signal transduction histidine kinase